MHLRHLQALKQQFEHERGWEHFPASLVYIHLIEELGEIGRHILFDEGYKVQGLGHRAKQNLKREFGQVLSLLLQLANRAHIDLEDAYRDELQLMEKRFDPATWQHYMQRYRQEHQ